MQIIDQNAFLKGIQINYYIVCPTKLWLFSHFDTMEHSSDLVNLGKLLQENSFTKAKKDLIIDQKIAIDFIKKGNKLILHEIKKSNKIERAHVTQLLYYLFYLKHTKRIENLEGVINYPSQRKIIKVRLTTEKELELLNILQKIKELIKLPKPPNPEKKKYCRKCSYFELCWI